MKDGTESEYYLILKVRGPFESPGDAIRFGERHYPFHSWDVARCNMFSSSFRVGGTFGGRGWWRPVKGYAKRGTLTERLVRRIKRVAYHLIYRVWGSEK